MAKKDYIKLEEKIIDIFRQEQQFNLAGNNYKIIQDKLGKPRPSKGGGETKTDVYILGIDDLGNEKELKISVKLPNYEFIENKITEERAEQIFGRQWKDLLANEIKKIAPLFHSTRLVNRTNRITLGWKLEIANKSTRALQLEIAPGKEAIEEIYSGKKLVPEKRNGKINGKIIENSGVANYLLVSTEDEVNSTKDIIDMIQPISLMESNKITLIFTGFTATPLFKETETHTIPVDVEVKTDGDRPLVVYIDWVYNNVTKELEPTIIFDDPLVTKGHEVMRSFKNAVKESLEDYTIS